MKILKQKFFQGGTIKNLKKIPETIPTEKNPSKEDTMNCIFFRRYAIQKRIKLKVWFLLQSEKTISHLQMLDFFEKKNLPQQEQN